MFPIWSVLLWHFHLKLKDVEILTIQGNEDRAFDLGAEEQLKNSETRRKYGRWILVWALGWQFFVGVVVSSQAFALPCYRLSDSVLVAIQASSPVGIFSVLIVLAKYYFLLNRIGYNRRRSAAQAHVSRLAGVLLVAAPGALLGSVNRSCRFERLLYIKVRQAR